MAFDCEHCDEWGFCKKYSNDAVVWKCKEDAGQASVPKIPSAIPGQT